MSKFLESQDNLELTQYDPQKEEPIIMVMGVGGGGGNIVTAMYETSQDISGVSYVLCNTDKQDLFCNHKADLRIQIGEGLGAGGKILDGKQLVLQDEKAVEQIKDCFRAEKLKMVFLVSSLGGGTGTGCGSAIAQLAKEISEERKALSPNNELLIVGVVSLPPLYEGKATVKIALNGLDELMNYTDTVIVINNETTERIAEKEKSHLDEDEYRALQNQVLIKAVKAISWMINTPMKSNRDFNDVKSTLKNSKTALISIGYGSGEVGERMKNAINDAINSDYLNTKDLFNAKKLLYYTFDNSSEGGSKIKRIESQDIVRDHLIRRFTNIDEDSETEKPLIIGSDNKFPDFDKYRLKEDKNMVGILILASGFMFQREELYLFDTTEKENNDKVSKEELRQNFYQQEEKKLLNPRVAFITPIDVINSEETLNFLESKSPAKRQIEDKKTFLRIVKEERERQKNEQLRLQELAEREAEEQRLQEEQKKKQEEEKLRLEQESQAKRQEPIVAKELSEGQ